MGAPSPTQDHDQTRAPVATAVAVLAVLGVIGSVLMSLAHLDLGIPVISGLGPTGRALPPVAIGFAFGAVLFAIVAYAIIVRASWAWPAALVVNGIALVAAVMPWRGITSSGPAALVTVIALALLISPGGRRELLQQPLT